MDRRKFLKSGCGICMLGTSAFLLNELAACSPAAFKGIKTDITDNKIQVPLAGFDQNGVQVISPRKYAYDIAAYKNPDQSYTALLMRCTHMDNQLTVTGTGFYCSLHGSVFDKEGHVKKGPAERKLKELKTEINQSNLIIYL
jgi:Rieske Fe-S protein